MGILQLLPRAQKNILLKNYTTFRIGGPAKYFFVAKNKKELITAVKVAKKFNLPFFILGGGSNILVSDKGYNGLVINFQLPSPARSGAKVEKKKSSSTSIFNFHNSKIFVGTGLPLGKLVSVSVEKSLTGLEWAAGIPGTVGGAISGNAGAFGKSMKDIVKEVETFDIKNQKTKIFKSKDCKFNYRDSIFKHKKNLIILSATFQLKQGEKSEIQKRIKKYHDNRKKTQPLNLPSAGSIFKNPSRGFSAGKLGEEDKSSSSRLAAARLIEDCGLKGKRIREVKVSEKHANFIVNLGDGKAKDVIKLIKLIKRKVKNRFKINLEEEIQFLGFKKSKF